MITLGLVAALAGCSASDSGSLASAPDARAAAGAAAPAAIASASAAAGGTTFGGAGGNAQSVSAGKIVPVNQQLIYTAQLTVRAGSVGSALSRATSIVTAAGGYVSAETTSGGGQGQSASAASATVTLKIPAAVYQPTLARLTGNGLGTQLDLSQQAQDVTQQVADVSSEVTSDEAAITQLRVLLKHAGSVGGLLSVQDQINTEESDLESMLAQQQALNHETAYATVTLTILGPKAHAAAKRKPTPPPGLASGLSGGWRAFRLAFDWLLAIIGAAAPFAAVLIVLAGGAWWARKRLARGGRAAGPTTTTSD